MLDGVEALITKKAVKLYEKFGIFTKAELESRKEVLYETYAKTMNIEALAMIDIGSKHIIPAVVRHTKTLADTVNALTEAGADARVYKEFLSETTALLIETKEALKMLIQLSTKASGIEEARERAVYYKDKVKTAMEALRSPVDKLEMIVDKEVWPMPSYGDLIFEI